MQTRVLIRFVVFIIYIGKLIRIKKIQYTYSYIETMNQKVRIFFQPYNIL